jgi:hypothetical protein
MTQQEAEVLTSGSPGAPREPRSWTIPAVVTGAAVLGVIAVPVLLALLGSQPTDPVATSAHRPSASASGPGPAVASEAPTAVPATLPSRAPRASLALATPVPPNRVHVPTPQPTRPSGPASGTPSVGVDPSASPGGGRSGALEPLNGPAGRTITLSGHCVPGADARYRAGSPSASKHPVTGDGSFTVHEQVATDAAQARTGAQVPLEVTCLDAAGNVTFRQAFTFQVTAVVGLPDQVPGDAGQLGAPQSAAAGSTVTVSGGGFLAGAPVVFGVRNLDSGREEGTRQVLADDGGGASVSVPVPGPAQVQVVAAGVDPGGSYRVLVATVTTN